jgi:hypothetical protein
MDQEYNEPTASAWIHGIGFCNQFNGQSWLTTIPIVNYRCHIDNKCYIPKYPEKWDLKKYKVNLVYEFVLT